MKTTLLLSALLASLGTGVFAACSGHDQATMSCTDGTIWDAEKQACVPTTS